MLPYLTDRFGNPSSHHTVGEAAASALADARARVADVLGVRASDVVFTSGGTEADNLAIKGLAIGALLRRRDPRRALGTPSALNTSSTAGMTEPPVHVITTAIEHEAVPVSYTHLTLPTNREV